MILKTHYEEDFLASIDSSLLERLMGAETRFRVSEYVYDVHTYQGKRNGKTQLDFLIEENAALNPKQAGLFDNGILVEVRNG